MLRYSISSLYPASLSIEGFEGPIALTRLEIATAVFHLASAEAEWPTYKRTDSDCLFYFGQTTV